MHRLLVLLVFFLSTSVLAAPNLRIDWRVEAGFAPFGYASDPDRMMQDWKIATGNDATWAAKISEASFAKSPFAELIERPSGAPWNASTGQYDRHYVHPTHTTIRARLAGEPGSCAWSVSGRPGTATGACDSYVGIADVPLVGATLSVHALDTGSVATESIKIDHRIVLALGDSYASGEGNPDVPTVWKPGDVNAGTLDWLNTSVIGDAAWWDNACHRSFWSNQTLVALKIASADPHRLVTYLQYSCLGAEILDGLVTRQANPPGIANAGCWGKNCYAKSSQLAAAVRDLCVGRTTAVGVNDDMIDRKFESIVRAKNAGLYRADSYDKYGLHLLKCEGTLSVPDLVLLSIGGNDAGFSSLAGWAIAPSKWRLRTVGRLIKGGLVCPDTNRQERDGCRKPYDIDLSRQLLRRYQLLAFAMNEVMPVAAGKVVQTTYPDPLMKSDGSQCHDEPGLNQHGAWTGAAHVVGMSSAKEWEFNILRDEAKTLSAVTIPQMREAILDGVAATGFVLADTHLVFTDHGWCDAPASDPPLMLPSFSRDPAAWRCGNAEHDVGPSCWRAYQPSRRFIRTMNDALLTQSSGRKDGQSGALHPNLGGHAVIADVLYAAAAQSQDWIALPLPDNTQVIAPGMAERPMESDTARGD